MKDKLIIGNEKNILFYNDENGNTKVEVLLENEDVWLNTEASASLFNIDVQKLHMWVMMINKSIILSIIILI